MKNRILILFLLFAIAIPQVVSAVWWNPFSWFDNWNFLGGAKTEYPDSSSDRGWMQTWTRDEFEAKYKVESDISSASSTKSTSATIQVEAPKDAKIEETPKAPLVNTASSDVTRITNPEEVQLWITTLNSWVSHYQKKIDVLQANSNFATDFKNKYADKLADADETMGGLLFISSVSMVTSNQNLIKELSTKIADLSQGVNQTRSTGYFDRGVWTDAKFTEMQSFSTRISSEMATVYKEYKDNMALMGDFIESLNGQKSDAPSYSTSLPSSYAKCSQRQEEIDEQVRAEISQAGGFSTESQVLAMVLSRMKTEGLNECFSGSGSVGGGSSTHCNYLNGGLDCTSSDGTRTYVNPIPGGGGVDIRSY